RVRVTFAGGLAVPPVKSPPPRSTTTSTGCGAGARLFTAATTSVTACWVVAETVTPAGGSWSSCCWRLAVVTGLTTTDSGADQPLVPPSRSVARTRTEYDPGANTWVT